MHGFYDLEESIKRIQAFEAAGADCVYVTYLNSLKNVEQVCNNVSVPVNVGISPVTNLSMEEFPSAGAARISLGMAMATAASSTLHAISASMFGKGDFSGINKSLSYQVIDDCVRKRRAI